MENDRCFKDYFLQLTEMSQQKENSRGAYHQAVALGIIRPFHAAGHLKHA